MMFDPAEDTGVGGIERMSDKQRRVEVGEAGCMLVGWKSAGVE